jgi:hypothetical protein
MTDKLDFYMRNTSFECPICRYHSGKLWEVKNPPKDKKSPNRVGHIFIKCMNDTECTATTFFGPYPPTLSKNGTIGNPKIGEWTAWDSSMGPKRIAPLSSNSQNKSNNNNSGNKRRREEPSEESEDEPKQKVSKTELLSLLKMLESEKAKAETEIEEEEKSKKKKMTNRKIELTEEDLALEP